MYLTEAWYVAAWDHEIARAPLSRALPDRPIVFWRTGDGGAVAMEDRCRRHHAPLSAGAVTGDTIRCGYHGLVFDRFNTHGITPETASTRHHFWMSARDSSIDDEAVTETLATIRDTFMEDIMEDIEMVEAQQRSIATDPDAPSIDVNADQPTIQARNLMDRLIRMQTEPARPARIARS